MRRPPCPLLRYLFSSDSYRNQLCRHIDENTWAISGLHGDALKKLTNYLHMD
ncbi:hypothetical protein DPMN_063818 [Dreissena polymorpha]|uniref:Uncharacterized protein n=1 Tax=Dreissena polymorpha TaxID=45954 RepID=A0A9D4CC38_DREPO|nr:hypothetical protein DPMN_063818 [Dreissena polymorpha]